VTILGTVKLAVSDVGWRGVSPRSVRTESYRGYRYPAEIISYAVWLYFRFSLSLRDVEELLAERGVTVTYETIRAWCAKFGPSYAAGLRRRRARTSDKWHLDEVQLKIKGKRHWLWRAVDKHGVVLDILVQQRRDQHAAETFQTCGGCSRVRAAGGDHRQAGELSAGASASATQHRASAAQGAQQPSGESSSADAST
jgi:DDE domain